MNFLADESVDGNIVERLRDAGHIVIYVAELSPSIDDDAVLELARQSAAVLITGDKDFGDLVFQRRQAACGVVLLRLSGLTSDLKATLVLTAITAHLVQLTGSFTVIAPGRIRIRSASGQS